MGYRKGYYKKNGTYVQGHFANTRSKSFSNKNNGCSVLLLAVTLLGFAVSCSETSDKPDNKNATDCPTKTCGDFSTQAQAQSTYNSNKKCYKNLDADGDGIARENLPKKNI
ncbi:excalibur calcium-binding domain-containing protein [Flavobacterium sp. LS1R49]|uniref:Excalibur calcium-binding domain-containing protein n=1 Tax=Flavobacterium shii TaxID=2987687 RepID=A0A9X2ZJ94_9FLAO|nr:excalibur calcium-binding domain-containing protein [Flavobacterium shii]MCV9930435.1 excalibur calcium-binding domain-containing protein [Flavobacterium shii]